MIDDSRGMTPERRKHIHDHRKKADSYGPELPVQIGKPKKTRPRNIEVICDSCGQHIYVSKVTYLVECLNCKSLVKIEI